MIVLEQIETQIAALALQKNQVVSDAKSALLQLEAAEQALQTLRAPLLRAQFLERQRHLIQLQSSTRGDGGPANDL